MTERVPRHTLLALRVATNASRSQRQASARTYASVMPQRFYHVLLRWCLKDCTTASLGHGEKREGKGDATENGFTAIPRTAYSRTGMSKKSAKSTKVRRSHKEHRVAIVKQDCDKCAWEKKVMKYEEDLTDDERFNVERVFDRTVERVDEETIC